MWPSGAVVEISHCSLYILPWQEPYFVCNMYNSGGLFESFQMKVLLKIFFTVPLWLIVLFTCTTTNFGQLMPSPHNVLLLLIIVIYIIKLYCKQNNMHVAFMTHRSALKCSSSYHQQFNKAKKMIIRLFLNYCTHIIMHAPHFHIMIPL